jgi:hypothetical protein
VARRGEAARLLEGREIPQGEWLLGCAFACRYKYNILLSLPALFGSEVFLSGKKMSLV